MRGGTVGTPTAKSPTRSALGGRGSDRMAVVMRAGGPSAVEGVSSSLHRIWQSSPWA